MTPTQAIERLKEVIRRQHKALATEESYLLWLRRYVKALDSMHAEALGVSSPLDVLRLSQPSG